MATIPYSEIPKNAGENYIPGGSKEPGAVTHLDTKDGYVYDKDGNQVARWDVLDGEQKVRAKSSATAQYVAAQSFLMSCYAVSQHDPERARQMLEAARRDDEHNPMHLLDLGTGDVHTPSALPNIAMGYRNEPPMADVYSPPVLVPKPSDYYNVFDKNDAFQRAYPTGGTGGASVAEIAPRLATTLFTTTERALGGFVATQVEAAADVPLRILTATSKRVMNAMALEREIRVQSLARTTSNWNSNNVLTVAAGAKWNGGGSSDPIKDLQGRDESSLMGLSGILMALPTFNAMVRNPAARAYWGFKDTDRDIPTPQDLSKRLGLPPIYVSRMRYIGSAGTPVFVWGGDVVLFRNPDEMPPTSQDDIASSYSFRWNMTGKPSDATQVSGGYIVRQYYDQNRGSMGGIKVVVVHQDAEVQTSAYVGGLIVNAYV